MHTEIARSQRPATPPAIGAGLTRKPSEAPDVFGNIFIGIAGMIGAGKSTLATALGQHLGIDSYYEPVADNEYLADFYRDTARYSFAMQVYLLNRRFQQHQEIIWRGRSAVQDRTIYEDSIFAKMLAKTGLMDERDYRTYVDLFRNMSNFMCKPSVIVFLDVSPEASAERIRMRSRDIEAKIEAIIDDFEKALVLAPGEVAAALHRDAVLARRHPRDAVVAVAIGRDALVAAAA